MTFRSRQTFGGGVASIGRRTLALAAIVTGAAGSWPAVEASAFDQGPVLRVLRQNDVARSSNQYLPTGAISPAELLQFIAPRAPSARRSYAQQLHGEGILRSAISAFRGPGTRELTSYASEFVTAHGARLALSTLARLEANLRGAAMAPDHAFVEGFVLTSRSTGGWETVEVLVSSGGYVYSLADKNKVGQVGRSLVEHLLRIVIYR